MFYTFWFLLFYVAFAYVISMQSVCNVHVAKDIQLYNG